MMMRIQVDSGKRHEKCDSDSSLTLSGGHVFVILAGGHGVFDKKGVRKKVIK
jgi:hypothetical protein